MQGRIIHEAGKAEASGPLGPPGTSKIYKVGPLLAPKFLERKFAVIWNFCQAASRSAQPFCHSSSRDWTTFLSKEGNSKNRTKIRSTLQIYVRGARSRFHASGPGDHDPALGHADISLHTGLPDFELSYTFSCTCMWRQRTPGRRL